MEDNKWIINRAGLLNFWYYDEEEFDFSDGKLLLRGSNGSGKSVTMQSFIPLLLDGNKSPERLDPFGSKARKIENYLLGDEDSGKDESIGYLYMEFKKRKTENYITIGMGFKASRGKALKSWGFVINDGRRIGKDIFLYKKAGGKLPLTAKELQNKIGSGGQIAESQHDYMKLVNNHLFGYNSIDDYDELIKLLVQLRTPKLSKDFKPTVSYEIMENSLQPLSEEDLRPMSEAIENMDNIKSRLEQLKDGRRAAYKIKSAFDKYNSFFIFDKARLYKKYRDQLKKLQLEKSHCQSEKERSGKEYLEAENRLKNLDIQKSTVEEKKRELDKHDSIKIRERIEQLNRNIENLSAQKEKKDEAYEKKRKDEASLKNSIKKLEEEKDLKQDKIEKILLEMDDTAEEIYFDEQSFMEDEIKAGMDKEYSFNYVESSLEKYIKGMREAFKAIQEQEAKNKEYDGALEKLEKSKQQREEKLKTFDETRNLLLEIQEEYIEKLYDWRKNNREFKLTEESINSMSRLVNNFDYTSSFDDIIALARNEYNAFERDLSSVKYRIEMEKQNLEELQKEKKQEIENWKNKEDPEPEREQKVVENRKKLKKMHIPFIPFYRAVDFKDDISEKVRGKLEEALMDMGLLDALVIPKKYRDKVLKLDLNTADKYIFPKNKACERNLFEFLKPESVDEDQIDTEDVNEVLGSILIHENSSETYIDGNGQYSIGLIKGNISGLYVPRFIGTSARNRYRQDMINRLSEELEEIEDNISKYSSDEKIIESRLNLLKQEFDNIPSGRDISAAVYELKDAEFKYKKACEDVQNKNDAERKIYGELKSIKEKVYQLTLRFRININTDDYENALEAADDYRENLFKLEKIHGQFLQIIEKLKIFNSSMEDIFQDIDDIIYDRSSIERELKESSINLENSQKQLELSDYEAIKIQVEECIRLLREIPEKIKENTRKSEREKKIFEDQDKKIADISEEIQSMSKIEDIYRRSFEEEASLGYVVEKKDMNSYELADNIIKNRVMEDKSLKVREDYSSMLFQKFQENNQYLREYTVKTGYIFTDEAKSTEEAVVNASGSRRRVDITAKVRGKDVNFYRLVDFIEDSIKENEMLLKEGDRQLFEDILVNNISKKIRARIFHSEKWVKKMNELMESMNTSSGLSFSLRWSSKKAETEEQMDTRELVELLKQDGNLLKPSDLNKLSGHFRSKISEARRILEDKGQSQTFHGIMKEILDYRKWFEFKLYYVKKGGNKKELTNNAFYQFSGGEKAMAMYVPLFSAVYAKYEGARADSPRIISLDEAFAGVDEKNIRDMFRLLDELDLNYIINSQILWGDYDTVPSLSICELLRPDNAEYVTVMRYKWNGKVKELLV
ncbi:TIGR02680 family protein [Clostridium sp. JNZ X4-2]